MREIEFRAWDKEINEMIFQQKQSPCFGRFEGESWCSLEDVLFYYKQSFVLMQYTGLKDKNGTKIFEGDVLHWKDCSKNSDGSLESNVVVVWNDKNLMWGVEILDFAGRGNIEELSDYSNADEIEVIGNIYENSELLEVED